MNQWHVLVWKELVETRWALYFSLLLMLLVLGIHGGSIWQFGTLFYLAVAIALLLGVISSCRDRGEAEVFWRSRPIGTMRFTAVKYLCGLVVVLVSFGLVSSPALVGGWTMVQLDVDRDSIGQYVTLAAAGPLVIAACYSLSFLTGSVVHRTHQAVILAIAAVLVLLFLPMLLPPVRDLGYFHQIEMRTVAFSGGDDNRLELSRSYLVYALAMGVLIAATAAVSAAAFRRNWHIAMDQKLMVWLLGGLAVMMLATAAYQVGSNIEPVREIALPGPPGQHVITMAPGEDGRLLVLTATERRSDWGEVWMHVVDPDAAVPIGAPPHKIGSRFPLHGTEVVWLQRGRDSVAYVRASEASDWDAGEVLRVIDISSGDELHQMRFDTRGIRIIGIEQDQLLLSYWDQLVTADISRPSKPAIYERSTRQRRIREARADESRLVYAIPELPALRRRDDLMMDYIAGWYNGYGGEWPIYARMWDHQVEVFRLTDERESSLVFERVGTRSATPLERFTSHASAMEGAISRQMYFILSHGGSGMMMTVYDLHDPTRPRKFGHFVRPRERLTVLQPMPDGRMIAGGDKLYVFDVKPSAK